MREGPVVHSTAGGTWGVVPAPQNLGMSSVDRYPQEQPLITCPMECEVCVEPGDCEDCLDCLYWPNVVDDDAPYVAPARGRSLPIKSAEIEAARRRVVTSKRVGLISRRLRRIRGLSQRRLAADLGWSHASLGRMEMDASAISLSKVETLVQQAGYRIAFVAESTPVPGEITDDGWEAADLIARDRAGRRLSPLGPVTWNPPEDLRQDASLRGREWTWRRPGPD